MSLKILRVLLRRARTYKDRNSAANLAAALDDTGETEKRQEEASAYADRVIGNPNMCKYGHPNCADRPAGKCSDEVLTNAGL